MTARFNHTIVASLGAAENANLFEATEAPAWGPFRNIQLSDGVLSSVRGTTERPPP